MQRDARFIDPDCEKELLGTCIGNPHLAPIALEKLGEQHFSVSLLRKVFRSMAKLVSEGKKFDEFALDGALSGDPEYASAGGFQYLIELAACAVPFKPESAISALSDSLHGTALRRKASETLKLYNGWLEDPSRKESETISTVREEFTHLEDESQNLQRTLTHVSDIGRELTPTLLRLSEDKAQMLGFSTGFHGLDRNSSGFVPGGFTILAARPSVGKTAFAVCVALLVSRAGHPVAIFSIETPRDMLLLRMVCRQGRIDLHALTSGRGTSEDWEKYPRAAVAVDKLPIYVDDRPRPKAGDLRARIRSAAQRFQVQLVIVDYLQLVTAKGDTRNDAISEVSGELQAAARELGQMTGGALLALSQLNRLAADEEPQLHHLRDSGAIEQDADSVWFLHSKDSWPGQLEPSKKQLLIKKSRNGPTGKIFFDYIGQCMAFEESESER